MTLEELNDLLGPEISKSTIVDRLRLPEVASDPITKALKLALDAQPVDLFLHTRRPLTDSLDIRELWRASPEGDYPTRAALLEALDGFIDHLSNPVITARLADLLWWSPEYGRSDRAFVRFADRALKHHREIASASQDVADSLASCWAGSLLANRVRRTTDLEFFRTTGIQKGFELVQIDAPDGLFVVRGSPGLGYLFGVVKPWLPFPHSRELTVIAELAWDRLDSLGRFGPGAGSWIHFLRYVAAGADDFERARVVTERAAADVAAMHPEDHGMFATLQLSNTILDVSKVAALTKERTIRESLEAEAAALVILLQKMKWVDRLRPSAQHDNFGSDATNAAECWRRLNAQPQERADLLRAIGNMASPLSEPTGLAEAAAAIRPTLGPWRSRLGPMGLALPDSLSESFDSLARDEASTKRIGAWGQVVADWLDEAQGCEAPSPAWFKGSLIAAPVAECFARATAYYYSGEWDTCVHIAIPRLEAVIRRAAISRDIPVLQRTTRDFGKIGYLHDLLFEIGSSVPEIDKSHWEYLRLLLAAPTSFGLRNVICHGLRSDLALQEGASRQEAALVVHAAAFLTGLDERGERGKVG